jgi:hypothetical protein
MRVFERFFRGLMMFVLVIVLGVLLGFVVEHLWNWLMPGLFGLRTITYWQAVGLFLLSKILLGGFHPRGGYGGRRRGWKHRMHERWAGMSPEEREKLRAGMRGRHGCGWSPEDKERFRAEVRARWGRGPREQGGGDASTKEAV